MKHSWTAFLGMVLCAAAYGQGQDFADEAAFKIEPFNGGKLLKRETEERPGPTGRPALSLGFESPKENSGIAVSWTFPARVLDEVSFTLHVKTAEGPIPYLRALFLGPDGRAVCQNTWFSFESADWKAVTFGLGKESGANSVIPPTVSPGQQVDRISLQMCGRQGKSYRAWISDFAIVGVSASKRVPRIGGGSPPTISRGTTRVWLRPDRGFTLAGMELAGCWLEPYPGGVYPRFAFVDAQGKPVVLDGDDRSWTVQPAKKAEDVISVTYTRGPTVLAATYTAAVSSIRCDLKVVSEGDLRIASAGADRLFGVQLGTDDYGINPGGGLLHARNRKPRSYRRLGNGEKPDLNFTAARVGNRILYYKPLTASQQMCLDTEPLPDGALAWLGGHLLFRPPGFKNPATKLCHEGLSWQVETAGDVNADGKVDWVDCGIAYRDRHVKANPSRDPGMRDSYHFYHGMPGDTYERLTGVLERLDFAAGVWWVKGAMTTNYAPVSEAHPYKVEADPRRGDKSALRARIEATGSRVGIYYGHDYIDIAAGDWPPELVKLDPDGHPHKYYRFQGHQLHYKDNVRGLASGLLRQHYEKIIEACWLKPGDPVMLDTFTAYARCGYHPEFPATPQLETEAKHEIARWLKIDKGLSVAGEGSVEGTQDIVDYGAILYGLQDKVESKFWRSADWVPLPTVIYHGRTYFGDSWYEFRKPDPNWAAALALGICMWQWTTGHYPDGMYEVASRMFFNQNLPWSRNADAAIVAVEREGNAYRIRFDNGNALWADPETNAWKLEEKGVVYDGFTPFNARGVMAILKQGDFDLTLPVKEMLEVIPSQPHRDRLEVKIEKTAGGAVRVYGNFSRIPWKTRWCHKPPGSDREVTELRECAPVLMLRRARQGP